MSVLVCFHAHPDDEVFNTGGTMRRAADAGHRVVLVTATDGAVGEFPPDLLGEGESLVTRRQAELAASAQALGVHRLVMLGFADSGMAGTPDNRNPVAFSNIPVDDAAARLAEVLVDERADVLTVYDDNGGYGHPDHIRVHHVGVRAAEMAGVTQVFESVPNRDHMRRIFAAAREMGLGEPPPELDLDTFGVPEAEITVAVDVADLIEHKRAAMVAHASQIGDFGRFLEMPTDQLQMAFGVEWFRRADHVGRPMADALPL